MATSVTLPKAICPHCQYEWVPRTESPVRCPSCTKRLVERKKPLLNKAKKEEATTNEGEVTNAEEVPV